MADPRIAGPAALIVTKLINGCQANGLIATLAATALPTDDPDTTAQSLAGLAAELMAAYGDR